MSKTICHYMQSVKNYRNSIRKKRKVKRSRKDAAQDLQVPHKRSLGLFGHIPEEMLFIIFRFCHPSALGSIALVSKVMRNVVMKFLHAKDSLAVIIPFVPKIDDSSSSLSAAIAPGKANVCFAHFHNLGILLKRATCLFSTKERLKEVEITFDKLQDTHTEICTAFGSDAAYSCYGMFLHAFVAGWEDDEKLNAYMAIKGASCLDEKLNEVLRTAPASHPWYERYVRVFCREIFLDKATDQTEKAFWLLSILKPWPYVFQARLLFILYGPLVEQNGFIDWEIMETSPTFYGVDDPDLEELAEALQVLLNCQKEWSDNNLITVFDELTAIPDGWCFENVAKLLKLSGEVICYKVLGGKAASGKVHELAYLGYYVAQVAGQDDIIQGKGKKLENFLKLLKQVINSTSNYKDHLSLISALFNVWEENIVSLSEDVHHDSAESPEEQEQAFLASVHNLARCTALLMKECVSK